MKSTTWISNVHKPHCSCTQYI